MIELTIHTLPIAQPRQRQRTVTTGESAFAQNYTPDRHPVNAFKRDIRDEYIRLSQSRTFTGPIAMTIEFYMPRPKGKCWKRKPTPAYWHTGKPDLDNLVKSVKDALTGFAYRDDSQICQLTATKRVCAGGEFPRVVIRLSDASVATTEN